MKKVTLSTTLLLSALDSILFPPTRKSRPLFSSLRRCEPGRGRVFWTALSLVVVGCPRHHPQDFPLMRKENNPPIVVMCGSPRTMRMLVTTLLDAQTRPPPPPTLTLLLLLIGARTPVRMETDADLPVRRTSLEASRSPPPPSEAAVATTMQQLSGKASWPE